MCYCVCIYRCYVIVVKIRIEIKKGDEKREGRKKQQEGEYNNNKGTVIFVNCTYRCVYMRVFICVIWIW